ncbi:helix-turn-helix transcriptional regulator [Crocosphaera sp.]|uniref:helix-turn-helix domain-containing protein n=1 Tax=Crocosphaera sp. TaxID=2729996 RepID=UPI00261FAA7D|nr:helix-turn-helix transcriptional regulator [Crocosphaera sp.]MDJ0582807.1 helix-turn-helix transcriptional regulator [Crocosphaera sp.]
MIKANHLTNSIYPTILLTYQPPVPIPGEKLTIDLNRDGEFSSDHQLIVELVAETGKRLITLDINSSDDVATLEIPNNFKEGTYILQVIDNNVVLDSTEIDIFEDKNYAEKTNSFVEELNLEIQIKEKVEKEYYQQAFKLQEKVKEHYKHNPKLAAKSWEQFAEVLYDKEEIKLSKKALEKALEIYEGIKDLDNKEEIIDRINEKIEIVKHKLLQNRLPLLRKQKDYSQQELADKVGVAIETIQEWEQGKLLEELREFIELSEVLNCKINQLICVKLNYENTSYVKQILDDRQIEPNIRELRKKKHLNKRQLAAIVGVTPAIIQEWEQGSKLDNLVKYLKLVHVLDCDVDYLIGKGEDRSPIKNPIDNSTLIGNSYIL